MKKIAFFDLDGTLTRGDTFISFAVFAVGRLRFLYCLLRAAPCLVAWKTGFRSNAQAKQTLFSLLYKGMPEVRFKELCRQFSDRIEHDLRTDTLSLLNNHLKAQHEICILSASIGEWIRPWAARHGIRQVIATEAETDTMSGRLTGRFATPNCHGMEKVIRAKAAYPDLQQAETWAYGDSDSDCPILDFSTHGLKMDKSRKSTFRGIR